MHVVKRLSPSGRRCFIEAHDAVVELHDAVLEVKEALSLKGPDTEKVSSQAVTMEGFWGSG